MNLVKTTTVPVSLSAAKESLRIARANVTDALAPGAPLQTSTAGTNRATAVGGLQSDPVSVGLTDIKKSKADLTAAWRRRAGHLFYWSLLGLVVVAFLVSFGQAGWDWKHTNLTLTVAAFATLLVLFIAGLVAGLSNGGAVAFVIGPDNRISTSRLQVALWTIAVVFAFFLFIVEVVTAADPNRFEESLTGFGAEYLLLLGGPFAAAVAAYGITTTKLAAGTVQQVAADAPAVKDIATDQSGAPSLPDIQFLLFNLVALGYFAVALAVTPTVLPDIPMTLLALTSLSALTYLGAKAVTGTSPAISAVIITSVPSNGALHYGDTIQVLGNGFETPETTATVAVEHASTLAVLFGSAAVRPDLQPGPGVTDGSITVTVPPGFAPPTGKSQVSISVLTAAGVVTQPFATLYVEAPSITNVSRTGTTVDVSGYGFGPDKSARTIDVTVGGVSRTGQESEGGGSSHLAFELNQIESEPAAGATVSVTIHIVADATVAEWATK